MHAAHTLARLGIRSCTYVNTAQRTLALRSSIAPQRSFSTSKGVGQHIQKMPDAGVYSHLPSVSKVRSDFLLGCSLRAFPATNMLM